MQGKLASGVSLTFIKDILTQVTFLYSILSSTCLKITRPNLTQLNLS